MNAAMTKSICFVLAATMLAAAASAQPATGAPGLHARLQWFLGDEEQNKALLPVIEKLDSEKFAEREAASAKLADLPALPPFVRALSKTDERPEVRFRLREIAKRYPLEQETRNLNAILVQIAEEQVKGTFAYLVGIVKIGMWTPDATALENASRATVTKADLPALTGAAADESTMIRRLAAAAFGGLPADQSSAPLRRMLEDPEPSVALLAAAELARREDPSCLPCFARLLDAMNFHTRHRSWSALKGLSGQTFGYDPSASADDRAASARRWQDWSRGPEAAITGQLPESSAIVLFNGSDLSGWEVFENGQPAPGQDTWEVRDGLLVSVGQGRGDIRTTARFDNYSFSLDYRTEDPRGDGGIGVMLTKENEPQNGNARFDGGSYLEVQLLPGRTGDIYVIGQFQAQAKGQKINFSNRRTVEVEDPVGQWNTMKLTVRDGAVEVELNGTVVNRVTGGSQGPGKIVLRNEGNKISYRNLLLHPLTP